MQAEIAVQGIPVRLTDTAGLRETTDEVETIGIDRARDAIASADLVLAVTDASAAQASIDRATSEARATTIKVLNKIDLTGVAAGQAGKAIHVSRLTGPASTT